jgi:arylsulfatase A-like enzyme
MMPTASRISRRHCLTSVLALLTVSATAWVSANARSAARPEVSPAPQEATPSANRPNVLFIAVDDLNHWIGPLGRNPQVKTPNLDRLAKMGLTFNHAYCAAPVCNPSRAALMSGLRPGTSTVYSNDINFEPRIPTDITLTTQFRKAGYWVGGAGKIYHMNVHRPEEWETYGKGRSPQVPVERDSAGPIRWGRVQGGDEAGFDKPTADWAIKALSEKRDRPFFLACGIYRPHMPFEVPQKYYDMYPLDKIELPPYKDDDLDDLPPAGRKMAMSNGHDAIVKADKWKAAIQAYQASITYADYEVGRVLDALEKSPHAKNTIIVLWGDHGWHLGEKHHWRKFTLWEEATRAPLFFVVPGMTRPGSVSQRTVDFMSIYPTLCDLTGIPIPKHVEGVSLRPLLADPQAAWNRPAITTHNYQNHAIRTEKWRYIRYANGGEELYDEEKDPYEWTNLANKPEMKAIKEELAKWLPTTNKPQPPADVSLNEGEAKPKP